MILKRSTICLSYLCVIMSFFCVGCGGIGTDTPDLGTVTGIITMDGKPLPNCVVSFIPETGRAAFGVTDESGKYELSYLSETKGAKIGKNTVRIATVAKNEGAEEPMEEVVDVDGKVTAKNKNKVKEIIPAKYNTKTELKADVTAGYNSFNFDLKSK